MFRLDESAGDEDYKRSVISSMAAVVAMAKLEYKCNVMYTYFIRIREKSVKNIMCRLQNGEYPNSDELDVRRDSIALMQNLWTLRTMSDGNPHESDGAKTLRSTRARNPRKSLSVKTLDQLTVMFKREATRTERDILKQLIRNEKNYSDSRHSSYKSQIFRVKEEATYGNSCDNDYTPSDSPLAGMAKSTTDRLLKFGMHIDKESTRRKSKASANREATRIKRDVSIRLCRKRKLPYMCADDVEGGNR